MLNLRYTVIALHVSSCVEWYGESAKSAPIRSESAMERAQVEVEKVCNGGGLYMQDPQ